MCIRDRAHIGVDAKSGLTHSLVTTAANEHDLNQHTHLDVYKRQAHIGVDAKSGLTHSLVTTAANEHDLNQLGNLLHGEEQFVSADAGYQGAPQREELAEVDVDWLIAERPGRVKTLKQHPRKNKTAINIEYMKASIRARVEHPFRIIKRQFGFVKARYKGLLKNCLLYTSRCV